MKLKLTLLAACLLSSASCLAWEAEVTSILQHGDNVAVYLNPDPGAGSCSTGQPYILVVDGTPAANQRFSIVLTAIAAGRKVTGYAGDPCSTAIWGASRPTLIRLGMK